MMAIESFMTPPFSIIINPERKKFNRFRYGVDKGNMETKPLVLVTGSVPPDRDTERTDWLDPWKGELAVLRLKDAVNNFPEILVLLAGADRIIALPSPDLSGELIHFLAGWGLARPGRLLWLDKSGSVPLPGCYVPCPDPETLERELARWQTEREIRHAEEELSDLGYWPIPDHFVKAVNEGNEPLTGWFLKAGLPPDLTDDKGIPVLCLAARAGFTGLCRRLVEAGAQVNAVAPDRNNNALMDAAAAGNADLARLLIAAGTELNRQSKNDQTALMLAVGINNPAIVAALLDAGADTELKDVLGMTALQYAKILGFGQIVALFEKK
jgi:hypothetical protein